MAENREALNNARENSNSRRRSVSENSDVGEISEALSAKVNFVDNIDSDSDRPINDTKHNTFRRPAPKLQRNRRAKSLYGVTPVCNFGPKGSILDNSSTCLFLLTVNGTDVRGTVQHFWKSTGYCPPQPHGKADLFDLSPDMQQNIAVIAAIPHSGIEQVRIHWLLSLIKVKSFTKGGNPIYDFSKLDDVIDMLWCNGLKPGFELMGNPSSYFNDFDNVTEVFLWKDLIRQVAERYVAKYGLSFVSRWNFESWNEPDCKDFDGLNMSVRGFLNYYDACSEGLKSVSPLLIFGGPGDGCRHTQYADALLNHVVNGRNFFTGEKGVRIDFLSFHKKGDGKAKNIIDGELDVVNKIKLQYPSLAWKPFYNDEADPLVGWSKDREWRADSRYAAMVTKVIVQHQNIILANPTAKNKKYFNFSLLSNDNAFLSWYPYQFTERTLNARFQMNNTQPPHVQLIRKPVHSAMALLSLLGEKQLYASLTDIGRGQQVANDSHLGVLATVHLPKYPMSGSDSWQMTVILYNSNDTLSSSDVAEVLINIVHDSSTSGSDHMITGYLLSDTDKTPNAYLMWKKFGRPKFPTVSQFRNMRRFEGPFRFLISPLNFSATFARLPFVVNLPQPSVVLLHVCAKPTSVPDQVSMVTVHNISVGQVFVKWSDRDVKSKCILTYEVEFSPYGSKGPYIGVNDYHTIVTAFVYAPIDGNKSSSLDNTVRGFYRVRAVDYWKQAGQYSLPVKYPNK